MNMEHYKQKLEGEKARLEEDLQSVGGKNPDVPGDWEAEPDNSVAIETRDETANKFEDLEEREATNATLEQRLAEVENALKKIAAGTYGKCEICNQMIEEDRLEANPAARTCKTHLAALNGTK